MKDGQTQKAADFCVEGLKVFPDYTTAHLVLGQCYELLGRNVEAILEYRTALKSVPENAHVRNLLQRVEQREDEAFKAFAEERARKFKGRTGTLTLDTFALHPSGSVTKETGSSDEDPVEETPSPTSKIVTATLAEIYAKQGEFGEAIQTYRRLLKERPLESEQYTKRITELEELARIQQTEEKI